LNLELFKSIMIRKAELSLCNMNWGSHCFNDFYMKMEFGITISYQILVKWIYSTKMIFGRYFWKLLSKFS